MKFTADIWNVSITELIEIFRGSLTSLTPWMDKAHIPWIEGSSYDDWNEISLVLFKNIVEKTLQYSGYETNNLARYDVLYDSYQNLNMITVEHSILKKHSAALVSLSTEKLPFDFIKIKVFNEKNFLASDTLLIPYKEAKFFYCKHEEQELVKLEFVNVEI